MLSICTFLAVLVLHQPVFLLLTVAPVTPLAAWIQHATNNEDMMATSLCSATCVRWQRGTACIHTLLLQQSTDMSCPPGVQQWTCSKGFAAVGPCWDRETDGRTKYHYILHRLCSTYYAGSANNNRQHLSLIHSTQSRVQPRTLLIINFFSLQWFCILLTQSNIHIHKILALFFVNHSPSYSFRYGTFLHVCTRRLVIFKCNSLHSFLWLRHLY